MKMMIVIKGKRERPPYEPLDRFFFSSTVMISGAGSLLSLRFHQFVMLRVPCALINFLVFYEGPFFFVFEMMDEASRWRHHCSGLDKSIDRSKCCIFFPFLSTLLAFRSWWWNVDGGFLLGGWCHFVVWEKIVVVVLTWARWVLQPNPQCQNCVCKQFKRRALSGYNCWWLWRECRPRGDFGFNYCSRRKKRRRVGSPKVESFSFEKKKKEMAQGNLGNNNAEREKKTMMMMMTVLS